MPHPRAPPVAWAIGRSRLRQNWCGGKAIVIRTPRLKRYRECLGFHRSSTTTNALTYSANRISQVFISCECTSTISACQVAGLGKIRLRTLACIDHWEHAVPSQRRGPRNGNGTNLERLRCNDVHGSSFSPRGLNRRNPPSSHYLPPALRRQRPCTRLCIAGCAGTRDHRSISSKVRTDWFPAGDDSNAPSNKLVVLSKHRAQQQGEEKHFFMARRGLETNLRKSKEG